MKRTILLTLVIVSLLAILSLVGCGESTNRWTRLEPDGATPDARWAQATVYLHAQQSLLLFGGLDGDWTAFNDTWVYDVAANAWTDLQPAGELPPARGFHALAVHSATGLVYLFGGYFDRTSQDDLWVYDPTVNEWTELHPTGDAPGPREGHSLVYDPTTDNLILFGGSDRQQDAHLNDLWAYDPISNTWAELKPEGDLPPARQGHSMVYDNELGRLILFAGVGWHDTGFFNDLWAYDPIGNRWLDQDPSGDPRTWDWDETNSTWFNPYPDGKLPEARGFQAMVSDPNNGEILVFGGMEGTVGFNDLWSYDPMAIAWTEFFPDGRLPDPRCCFSMVCDPATGQVFVFGGLLGTIALDDLWSYTPRPIAEREPIEGR